MEAGVAVLMMLFAWHEADFLKIKNEQVAEGYKWVQIECRAPDPTLPSIKIKTPISNEYVCFKLEK